jgi:hypothetical protein
MKLRASLVALAALASMASASGLTLYEDVTTKQIFTEPGDNRQKIGNFIQENNVAEIMNKEVKGIPVTSKAKSIEFSGTHYFGFTSNQYGANNGSGSSSSAGFEFRRNYLQVKAFLNDKDYFRVTLDSIKELESSSTGTGQATGTSTAYVKYAYLWLDKVLPYTGVEIGVAHRPWIDYEEHNSWYYRSINKVLVEDKFSCYQAASGSSTATCVGPDIINSADLGVNFKTKTSYFTSEIGLFNGEGYHADKAANNQQGSNDSKLSGEVRLTAHILGNGDKVGKYDVTKDMYANISFSGMSSKNHKDNSLVPGDAGEYDREGYWIHGVFNHPLFLIAGQFGETKDKARNIPTLNDTTSKNYNIWSVNGEIRPIKDWTIIGRYDSLKTEYPNVPDTNTNNSKDKGDAVQWIAGVAYKYSKNINFIASYKQVDAKESTASAPGLSAASTVGDQLDKKSIMFTTEVKW